jgi:hypothetical protein
VGVVMAGSSSLRAAGAAASIAAVGLFLAACSQTTYGTGTTPGQQTLEDIAGIAAFGAPKKEPIDYSARPAIVPPPKGTPLPAPGDPTAVASANWPKDPDVEQKKFKAEVAARDPGGYDEDPTKVVNPNFSLPTQPQGPEPNLAKMERDQEKEALSTTAEQNAAVKKLFADARGVVAVDAEGKPIRRYLTDPPVEYREPDPNAPVEIEAKPQQKKRTWRWPWEQQDDTAAQAETPPSQ